MPLHLAFTSCMDTDRAPQQPVWDAVARCANGKPPDALLLLGDQVYLDWSLSGALAKVPPRLRRWHDGDEEARVRLLEEFAADLHCRYKTQWQVPEFQGLVKLMAKNRAPIAMAWDDHDFAWNNALGEAGQGRGPSELDNKSVNDKVVPPLLKRVSLALRSQFAQLLHCTEPPKAYPQPPPLGALVNGDFAVPGNTLQIKGFDITVLDQRWSRTHRDAQDARLLSRVDAAWLKRQVALQNKGLLILAGSSPLKHKSASGAHDGWWAPPDPDKSFHDQDRSYPEYNDLIAAAKRPVLYLGGDVHRNAWGGWIELPDQYGCRAPVLQALSSGAALGSLLAHDYVPSFGVVHIEGPGPRDAQVTVSFHTLEAAVAPGQPTPCCGKEPGPQERVRYSPSFQVREGQLHGWVDDGECSDTAMITGADERLLWQLAARPLPVLAMRAPGAALRGQASAQLLPNQLDDLGLTDSGGSLPLWPTLLTASASGSHVLLQRRGPGPDELHVHGLWDDTFARARAQRRSVVLFVHGFGKGFFAALSQATELQGRFPGTEAALCTWPSNPGSGSLLEKLGFAAVLQSAERAASGLSTAIATFCLAAQRHTDVPAVLLVRSMGALVLSHAAAALQGWPTSALRRVVLNAPACPAKHTKWMNNLACEVVSTVNACDNTLGRADWVYNGALMGNTPPVPGSIVAEQRVVLDCTQVPGVGRAHDYLLRAVNQPWFLLQQRLLAGERDINYTTVAQQVPGLRCHHRSQVYGPPPCSPP